MALFMLDTGGDQELLNENEKSKSSTIYKSNKVSSILLDKTSGEESKTNNPLPTLKQTFNGGNSECEDDDEDLFGLPPPNVDIKDIINSTLATTRNTTNSKSMQEVDEAIDEVEEAIRNAETHKKQKRPLKRGRIQKMDNSDINPLTGKLDDENVINANGIEALQQTSNDQISAKNSLRRKRQLNRNERDKTKGSGWFNLPATEVTEDVRNELKIIQMRSVLDPKHFYKKNDLKVLPKYFQIGTVQHSPLDYYRERNTRKTKKSLVDQLLEDEAFQKFNKRKYNEVIANKSKYAHRKAMQKMRKLKKNK